MAMKSGTSSGEYTTGYVVDGRYELTRSLGKTTGAVVFEARHRFTERRVAIKLVPSEGDSARVAELRARLVREVKALSSVRHAGVLDVLDGGVLGDGTPYVVTENLDGRTLEGVLAKRGKLSCEDTVALTLQLTDALEAAHDAGVVHRDIRPRNILVTRDRRGRERVKIVDFGTAQVAQSAGDEKLTAFGAVIGTPAYMAPERLLGAERVELSADIYALGITMFECLTGRLPYDGKPQQIILQADAAGPVPTVPSELCSTEVAAIVAQAMARRPEDRFRTCAEMSAAIRSRIPSAREWTTLLGPPPLPNAARSPVPSDAEQRRRWPRAPYVTPLRVEFPEGDFIDGRTEDISEGGLLVVCRGTSTANVQVTLRFATPIEGRIVTCKAHLRWVRSTRPDIADAPSALGLEFIGMPPDLRASIVHYIELMGDGDLM